MLVFRVQFYSFELDSKKNPENDFFVPTILSTGTEMTKHFDCNEARQIFYSVYSVSFYPLRISLSFCSSSLKSFINYWSCS